MSVKEAVRAQDTSAPIYEQRARYICNENGFDFSYPPVPTHQFLAERDRAFGQDTVSGMVELDASSVLGTAYAATTPTLLCRYVKVRADDRLSGMVVASGEIFCVIAGRGASRNGRDEIAWSMGNVFCFPGGVETIHTATDDAVLFSVSDAPLLALAGMSTDARSCDCGSGQLVRRRNRSST